MDAKRKYQSKYSKLERFIVFSLQALLIGGAIIVMDSVLEYNIFESTLSPQYFLVLSVVFFVIAIRYGIVAVRSTNSIQNTIRQSFFILPLSSQILLGLLVVLITPILFFTSELVYGALLIAMIMDYVMRGLGWVSAQHIQLDDTDDTSARKKTMALTADQLENMSEEDWEALNKSN